MCSLFLMFSRVFVIVLVMCSLFLCLELVFHCSWSCSLILWLSFGHLFLCSLSPCSVFLFLFFAVWYCSCFCYLSFVCCPSSLSSFFVLVYGSCSGAFFFVVHFHCVFCFYIVLCCWLAFDLYYCSCAFVLCVCLLLYILVLCSSIWFCYFLLSFDHEFVCCSCHSLLVVIGYLMLINVIMNIYSWLLMLFLVVVLRCWLDVFLCVVLWFLNLCFPCSWSCSFSKFLVIVLVVSYSCC